MENLDLTEILKNVPKGTKLYSTTHGDICFKFINYNDSVYPIVCYENGNEYHFTKEGKYHYNYNGECVLFPSKEQRDWSKFKLPCQFKIGDVLTSKDGWVIAIFNKEDYLPTGGNSDVLYYNCFYNVRYNECLIKTSYGIGRTNDYRYATETEKNILFDRLQEKGYFWNDMTNSLEKYKFKIGDKIQNINSKNKYEIIDIKHDYYILKNKCNLDCFNQNHYELYQEKFDITTLKPYDKVLVRSGNTYKWTPQFLSYLDTHTEYSYKFVIIGIGSFSQCIPYEGNEHLVGTTNDCDEYYKIWK